MKEESWSIEKLLFFLFFKQLCNKEKNVSSFSIDTSDRERLVSAFKQYYFSASLKEKEELISAFSNLETSLKLLFTSQVLRFEKDYNSLNQLVSKIKQWEEAEVKAITDDLIELFLRVNGELLLNIASIWKNMDSIPNSLLNKLIEFLKDRDQFIQRKAMYLFHILGPETIPFLLSSLLLPNTRGVQNVRSVILKFSKKAIPYLRKALSLKNPFLKVEAVKLLGELKASEAEEDIKALLPLARSSNYFLQAVLLSLGKIAGKSSLQLLKSFLKHSDIKIVESALDGLAESGCKEAWEILRELFESETTPAEIKLIIISNLKYFKDKEVASFLWDLIQTDVPVLFKREALFALAKSSSVSLREKALEFALEDCAEEMRLAAIEIIVMNSDKKWINKLKGLFYSAKERKMKLALIRAFGKMKDKQVLPLLLPLLKEKDKIIKINVILAVKEIKDVLALPFLKNILKEESSEELRSLLKSAIRYISREYYKLH